MKKIYLLGTALIALTACTPRHTVTMKVTNNDGMASSKETVLTSPKDGEIAEQLTGMIGELPEQPAGMILKASAFRMSGDYADRVAVTLDSEGELVYYPAPTDITADSMPTAIADGWYLNRQGLGPNSVFTRWTFEEYGSFQSVPTPQEIKAAIILGARVTEFKILPIPSSEAAELPAARLRTLLD